MRLSALVALLPAIAGVLASDVLDLNKETFMTEVYDEDLALVEFFAPWCGHCKNLAPHYEEAATTLKGENIKLAKVDCTQEEAVCKQYEVQGYPTLKVFRKGEPTNYNGPREAEGIIAYMRKQALPAVSVLTTDDHDEFTTKDNVVVIAYGDDAHPVPESFTQFADVARENYLFGKVEGSSLPELPKGTKLPALMVYKKFDEGKAVYEDDFAKDNLGDIMGWVNAQAVPLFDEIGPKNFAKYAESGLPLGFLFMDPKDETTRDEIRKESSDLFKEHRGKLNFVWIDGEKFGEYGKSLGVNPESQPGFVIQNLQEQTKFLMPEAFNAKSLSKFVKKFVAGDVAPHIKSQPIPESQDGPVYKLTSLGWDQLFEQTDKDIFVEFYAPWCGHCQRLAPIWDSLGESYKSANVVIAQMDATENDLPAGLPFRVEGFPTLKFRAAGSEEFIEYEGDRSLESLTEFIETNGKAPKVEKKETEADKPAEEEEEAPSKRDEL
ncbi:hypothetical protein CcaverHIS002_0604080 [Cutaneotrichosporon cavernicola]|uniref:Protein disulfide-isomerase n=1 Tax=Cutaneotrichosporon cavernicola TaxID=279322 RepID=A0AA48L8H9_9TREE|nr:uncharacterized protein CcaverHIS019_0603530 [Cutaneotrichosporon cavernicola]BEI86121.1 hypothetical protein CcaverHIS002_0604080 [Cutaneotrichosporon cavernicola]BEI93894.1 hypothetical protein CcaverHIS019_0603530 [Cutaneotrichosporon cavernicola]BEJ01672.1 hypothetical protein CcaverHIS631_0603540 [Cutaneotrichosporon cavernicola]BEJ09440.1 hypothetical protein CcaverHIS641_0603550 [Cutaneotrichosporon cavernicola]